MGSYKWGYKSLIWAISIAILLLALLVTTHEPPSSLPILQGQSPLVLKYRKGAWNILKKKFPFAVTVTVLTVDYSRPQNVWSKHQGRLKAPITRRFMGCYTWGYK